MRIYKFKDLTDEQKHSHFLQIVLNNPIWCASPDSLNDRDEEFRFTLDYAPSRRTHDLLSQVVAQYRHMAQSIDRLLTYAEGNALSERQILALKAEDQPAVRDDLFTEFANVLERAADRIRNFRFSELEEKRSVGKKQLPTTLAGLLVHIAEHTQRHAGQAVTTAKVVRSMLRVSE
jgi:hypothetical protein